MLGVDGVGVDPLRIEGIGDVEQRHLQALGPTGLLVGVLPDADEEALGSGMEVVGEAGDLELDLPRVFAGRGLRAADDRGLGGIDGVVIEASGSPRPPEFEYFDQYPLTDNNAEVTERIASAFRSHFGAETVFDLGRQRLVFLGRWGRNVFCLWRRLWLWLAHYRFWRRFFLHRRLGLLLYLWSNNGARRLDNLWRLCPYCHDLKTNRGWKVEGTPHNWKLVPPDDRGPP